MGTIKGKKRTRKENKEVICGNLHNSNGTKNPGEIVLSRIVGEPGSIYGVKEIWIPMSSHTRTRDSNVTGETSKSLEERGEVLLDLEIGKAA